MSRLCWNRPAKRPAYRPRLEILEDRWLPTNLAWTVTDPGDAGLGNAFQGDLRYCIAGADANPADVNTINFHLAGSGLQTINVLSPLPPVTSTTVLDATTEPGYAGTPLVVLNGSGAGTTDGLVINGGPAGGSFVRGLCVQQFQLNGLVVQGTPNTTVQGCFLGTDATGTAAMPNGRAGIAVLGDANTIGGRRAGDRNVLSGNTISGILIYVGVTGEGTGSHNVVIHNFIGTDVHGTSALPNGAGVDLESGASANRIGGTGASNRNIISGNVGTGVHLNGGTAHNVVQGNYVGTDASGALALPNGNNGIFIGADHNQIGGTKAGTGNVISANVSDGIAIIGSNNLVQGNRIGTDVTGTVALGNGRDGVAVQVVPFAPAAKDNTIGGTVAGAGNVIAFNGNDGVQVWGSLRNAIQENSIYANANLGIEFLYNGNHLQAAPTLTSAVTTGSSITIQGTLQSKANTTFTLEFFASFTSGSQGQQFLGSQSVITNGAGAATFSATFSVAVSTGDFITATATDLKKNTSAFSGAIPVTAMAGDFAGAVALNLAGSHGLNPIFEDTELDLVVD